MRIYAFICATLVVAMPATVQADDPLDPGMRSADARARDRAMTRQLNLEELERVRKRDARHATGTRAPRPSGNYADDEYSARSRDYERARADYAYDRARYEREKAAWRRAVAACYAGDYSACD